jgi:predicted amidohydrolase
MVNIKIGMAQVLVKGGDFQENLAKAESFITQSNQMGCDIVVFPECMDLGWTYPKAKELAQPIPGKFSESLCDGAKKNGIYIVAGLTEEDNDKIYNSAILVSPEGQILLKHRKINVLSIAQDLYSTGDRLGVAHTPIGTIGINICADNFPDSLVFGHSMARMGAQIIISPSAWAVKADHDNMKEPYGGMWENSYRELSALYEIYVIGVSNVGWITGGPWDGRKCIGSSLAVGTKGNIIKKGKYGVDAEELIVFESELINKTVTGTDFYKYVNERKRRM